MRRAREVSRRARPAVAGALEALATLPGTVAFVLIVEEEDGTHYFSDLDPDEAIEAMRRVLPAIVIHAQPSNEEN